MTLDCSFPCARTEEPTGGDETGSPAKDALEGLAASKKKRPRRGKKKRLRTSSEEGDESEPKTKDAKTETKNGSDGEEKVNYSSVKDEENCSTGDVRVNEGRPRVLIRPVNVPKAPENSTQFIMDDHEDCGLYFSFETELPPKNRPASEPVDASISPTTHPLGYDAAFQDIDYEYESASDLDKTAFYEKDFEIAYYKARFDELSSFSATEIKVKFVELEQQAHELSKEMARCNPTHHLEKLQTQLLGLQEENKSLKKVNRKLQLNIYGDIDDKTSEDASPSIGDSSESESENSEDEGSIEDDEIVSEPDGLLESISDSDESESCEDDSNVVMKPSEDGEDSGTEYGDKCLISPSVTPSELGSETSSNEEGIVPIEVQMEYSIPLQ